MEAAGCEAVVEDQISGSAGAAVGRGPGVLGDASDLAGVGVEGAVEHVERFEDGFADIIRIRATAEAGNDFAEEDEPEVAVFVLRIGRDHDAAVADTGEHLLDGGADAGGVPVAGDLAAETGTMREQASKGDIGDGPGDLLHAGELGDVFDELVVEVEQAFVAELHDRHAGDGFGVGVEAEEGAGVGRALILEVRVAEAGGPGELLVADDAD